MTNLLVLLVLVSLSVGEGAKAFTVTERVNCAGALAKRRPDKALTDSYKVGSRLIRVSITRADAYEAPTSSDYIEVPLSNDRLPTASSRIRPILRRVVDQMLRLTGIRSDNLVQFDFSPAEDLDSVTIQHFAAELNERGYTRESLARQDFDVRLGAMQFTGQEFWSSLYPAATRGHFLSINAERGFREEPGFFRAVTVPQTISWVTRGAFLATMANLGLHEFYPTIPVSEVLGRTTQILLITTLIPWLDFHDLFSKQIEKVPWLKPVRRLLLLLPDTRGLLNTARSSSVMEQRAKVAVENMSEALELYPEISTVQIVAESSLDVERLHRAVGAKMQAMSLAEQRREEATWTEPDPTFARFPYRLRHGIPNLKHRPTRDLIEVLKTTFAAKRFFNADEFIAYYRPENAPGWAEGRHDSTYQQYVAMYLFDSLRWSLPQFFALNPSPEQVRTLLEIPANHFDRGQLHEFPSGNAVLGTMALIAAWAEADQHSALTDIKVLPAFEYEQQTKNYAVRGMPETYFKNFSPALRPMPEDFRSILENRETRFTYTPDLEKFPPPPDGW